MALCCLAAFISCVFYLECLILTAKLKKLLGSPFNVQTAGNVRTLGETNRSKGSRLLEFVVVKINEVRSSVETKHRTSLPHDIVTF